MRKPFRLEFETLSDFGYLPFLTRIFRSLKIPQPYPLTQILVEAFNNAVKHAHHSRKKLWIGIELDCHPKKTRIRVLDQGKNFRLQRALKKTPMWQTHGRGLALIQAKADSVTSRRQKGKHILEVVCGHE